MRRDLGGSVGGSGCSLNQGRSCRAGEWRERLGYLLERMGGACCTVSSPVSAGELLGFQLGKEGRTREPPESHSWGEYRKKPFLILPSDPPSKYESMQGSGSGAERRETRSLSRARLNLPPHPSAMSLLRAFSALRLVAPSSTTTLCRSLSSVARPSSSSPLLSLASRPSLSSAASSLPLQQFGILGSVRGFKMPKSQRKSKSPLARGSSKTARSKGKRAVS